MTLIGFLVIVGLALTWLTRSMLETLAAHRLGATDCERREARLTVLECTTRKLQEADRRNVLMLCTEAVSKFGFDAAMVLDGPKSRPAMTLGDWRCVAPDRVLRSANALFASDPVDVLVTTWRNGDQRITHSVSAVLIGEGFGPIVMVGWSRDPVTNDLAECFATLMRFTARAMVDGPVIYLRVSPALEVERDLVETVNPV